MANTLIERITAQIEALVAERDEHAAKVEEIDGKIARAAAHLGLEPNELGAVSSHRFARMPARSKTMPDAMMEILLNAERGLSRIDLKRALKETEFAKQVESNENGFYNAVLRYIRNDKIVEEGALLYHPTRAPLPEGQDDPTGQHLKSNVSNLFGPPNRSGDA